MNEMKTVIEMAREAGLPFGQRGAVPLWDKEMERLMELVRAEENEACAKIADEAEPYNAADLIRKRMKQ